MTKQLLIVLLALTTTMHLTGCSSSGSHEEGESAVANDEQFADESEGDFAQDTPQDELEGQSEEQTEVATDESAAPEDGAQDMALDGQQPAEGGEAVADAGAAGEPQLQDELSLDGADGGGLPEDIAADPGAAPAPGDIAAEAPPADAPPATDAPLFSEPSTDVASAEPAPEVASESAPAAGDFGSSGTGEMASTEPAAPKSYAPYLKVKDAAFEKNGANLNRVYVARAGDTTKSIADKIYGAGSGKQKDLKAWNAMLQSRGAKVGDKVYYQSPSNPQDTAMLNYYEEIGATPETYVTKEGDNIRKVSKELLGDSNSWKEVWATNASVDSKGDVPAGLELKYWPNGTTGSSMPTQNMAQNDHGMDPMAQTPPPPSEPEIPMPPPPTDMAMNDIPPPPPEPPSSPAPASTPDSMAAGTMAPPPDQAPPPPPPPEPPRPVAKKPLPTDEMASSSDPDTMMAMGLGGILLMAAAVLFVVLRKNRAKRVDLSQTQV